MALAQSLKENIWLAVDYHMDTGQSWEKGGLIDIPMSTLRSLHGQGILEVSTLYLHIYKKSKHFYLYITNLLLVLRSNYPMFKYKCTHNHSHILRSGRLLKVTNR